MATDIELKNSNIMVKELVRKEEEKESKSGLYIPEEALEDEQVAQGIVVRSEIGLFAKGDVLMFHKVCPVDVNLKIDGDEELNRYFFIKAEDVICKIINK